MSLRLLIDMNLSPEWVGVLAEYGYDAVHWSTLGDPRADDTVIMAEARRDRRVVFTHDLDFGTLLALTHATGPSVVQFRGQNTLPNAASAMVVAALGRYEAVLADGALIVIEAKKSRVRVLPL